MEEEEYLKTLESAVNSALKDSVKKDGFTVFPLSVKKGLEPYCEGNPKILILGTFPGKTTLQKKDSPGKVKYYKDSGNKFWQILANDKNAKLNQEQKESLLNDKIALWDIYDMAIRGGSSDKNIIAGKYNDVYNFLEAHKSIDKIILCGITETSKVHPIGFLEDLLKKFTEDELNHLNGSELKEKLDRLKKQIKKKDLTEKDLTKKDLGSREIKPIVLPKPTRKDGTIECVFLPSTSGSALRKKEDFDQVREIWQDELKESINE